MTRRVSLTVLALVLAGFALAGYGYTRITAPEPQAEAEFECTSCDARQASKKRLREHIQSLQD